MKFLDKFILLPIERYERLLKGTTDVKKNTKELSEKTSTIYNNNLSDPEADSQNRSFSDSKNKSEGFNSHDSKSSATETDSESNSVHDNRSPVTEKNSQSSEHLTTKTDSQNDNRKVFQDNNSLEQFNKFPHRPPGIPNKKQKLMFKWESLF